MPDVYVADLTGRFIICSDGLHGEVPDEQIAAIAAAHSSPQEAVDALVAAALDAGGTDNITVIVADMPLTEPEHHAFSAFRLDEGEVSAPLKTQHYKHYGPYVRHNRANIRR